MFDIKDPGEIGYKRAKGLFDDISKRIAISPELHKEWPSQPREMDYLEFGMVLPFFFAEGNKFFLRNRNLVEQLVAEQETKGISKSYERVLLMMDQLSRENGNPSRVPKVLPFDVYLLRPVREATGIEDAFCDGYCLALEGEGLSVVNPKNSTNQQDSTGGYVITQDHTMEIAGSKRFDAYWKPKSVGSRVDLGTFLSQHFTKGMSFRLLNRVEMENSEEFLKSPIGPLLLYLDRLRT